MAETASRGTEVEAARRRLAIAQAALLTALTDGGPLPDGFDRARMRVQREALAAKRVGVLARVAPELPEILGDRYRPAALAYVRVRPLTGGYRQDALALVRHLLAGGRVPEGDVRRRLELWLRERAEGPPRAGRLTRLLRRRAPRA